MPAPDMIERVARAILAEVPLGYGMTLSEAHKYASAAIAAMQDRAPADDGQPDEAQEWRDYDPEC